MSGRTGRVLRAVLVVIVAAGAAPVGAQPRGAAPAAVCRLPVAPPPGARDAAPPVGVAPGDRAGARPTCAAPTARFDVTYTDFTPEARAAFQAAVDTWACLVASPVPIRVEARWEALAASTLGSAGPYLVRNFAGAPVPDTWVPAALADALAGRDLDADQPDVDAAFNRQFSDWHTDPATPPPPGAFDLYTVVLHELGHGLGIIGGLTVRDERGYVGDPDATRGPFLYDRFAEDAAGTPLLDADVRPDGSAALAAALRADVWFDGPAVRQAGGRARLYTPDVWLDGASYSHLDEATYAPATPDGLMTPFLQRGEAVAAPGAVTCALLADLGWTLGGACAALIAPLEPVAGGLVAERRGANPFTDGTRVQVQVAVRQRVRVTLVDATGRTVSVIAVADLEPGVPLGVRVDGRRLAAGVYHLVAQGESGTRSVPLVVVR